ncbi:MAG: nucleotidyl transferase AbiEii/AbiGii toxin family protein, partial [Isosphaeraceae bacterium]
MLENYLRESMERIKGILVELKIPFHFTGGIAVFYYGEPRFTQDLDLVIRLSAASPETEQLLGRLSEAYLIHTQTALQAIRERGLFQAIDQTTLVKIDFHVGEKIPGELDRTSQREFGAGLSNSRSLECHSSWFAHFDSDSLNRHHPDVEKDLRYGLQGP